MNIQALQRVARGVVLLSIFVLPVISLAQQRISPDGSITDNFSQSKPMKIALGSCQAQCFEGAVEYNPATLKVTRIQRYDDSQKAWVDIVTPQNQDVGIPALNMVIQNITLPGICPEEGCDCKMPAEKPPFSTWSKVTVSSDYVVKVGGKPVDYRAYGTVDYRSRVTQGQCDVSDTQTSQLP